ncbi:MAG: GFA family protein [Candidatus Thiodiazotropha sp. (ex Ctena orbiculata)]|nr:GFA family protein [Candidatus Thiodiazotropha taylori]
MTEHYQGSCHCGAVRFSFEGEAIVKGLRCNCSICIRKGAMMSSEAIPPEQFSYESDDQTLGSYQFGLKTARHYFCKQCGIYTFHETARMPGHFRVNLGCIEGVDPFTLEYDLFNGKHLL